MRKIGASLLVLCVLCGLIGCEQPPLPASPTKAELAVRYGVTEKEIDADNKFYPKQESRATEKDNFIPGRVIIGVYSFADTYDFKPEDFADVGCVKVEPLFGPNQYSYWPSRFLILTLRDGSVSGVLEAIEILQQRADIYSAQVDMAMELDGGGGFALD